VNAHGYAKRFVVRADEKLTAFSELQRAIHGFAVSLVSSIAEGTNLHSLLVRDIRRYPTQQLGNALRKKY